MPWPRRRAIPWPTDQDVAATVSDFPDSQSAGGTHLPFSAGPRKCIGDQLAMAEGQLILATTAQRFDLALAPDQRIDTTALITLNPKYGMKVIAWPRG